MCWGMTATRTSLQSCTRRTLLTGTAGAVCAVALTACGSGDDGGGDPSPEPTGEDGGATDGGTGGEDSGEDGGGENGGEAVMELDEAPVGEATAFTTPDGEDALLYRSDETTVVAYSAVCTHLGGALQPAGAELHCPLHQSVFDAETGEVLSGPADDALPAVPVRIEGDQIVAG